MHALAEVTCIDSEGIVVESSDETVMDLFFDDARIWSFYVQRDAASNVGDEWSLAWPEQLQPYLKGKTNVRVNRHGEDTPVFDEEVTFGQSAQRVAVVNGRGEPLTIDKSGRLGRNFEDSGPERIDALVSAMHEVVQVLKDEGIEAFLAYGTLLGAVRDGQLIGHDNDADLAYVSKLTEPVDVMLESYRLQRALVERGYPVFRYSGGAVKIVAGDKGTGNACGLDVFGGFLRQGKLALMGEIYQDFEPEWIYPLGTTKIGEVSLPAPAKPEMLLSAMYGPGWKVPDPAFKFEKDRYVQRRLDGWFRGLRVNQTHWDRLNGRAPFPAMQPSSLARRAFTDDPEATQFVDIGCGRGTDAYWFASQGTPSVGLDFSLGGMRKMRTFAGKGDLPVNYRKFNLLDLRSVLGHCAELVASTQTPRVVNARRVLEWTNSSGRANLWVAARMLTRGEGSRFYVEFMTKKGPRGRRKAIEGDQASANLGTPRDPELVLSELKASGAQIVDRSDYQDPTNEASYCVLMVSWNEEVPTK